MCIDGGDGESSLHFLVNWAVFPHPISHGLIDGLVTGDMAQDLIVKDTLGLDLPLGLVLVETARKKTEIELGFYL